MHDGIVVDTDVCRGTAGDGSMHADGIDAFRRDYRRRVYRVPGDFDLVKKVLRKDRPSEVTHYLITRD